MSTTHRRPVRSRVVRALGVVGAVVVVLAGLLALGGAAYMHFAVVSNFNDHSRPDHVFGSVDDQPMELSEPYGSYGITSVRGPLDLCAVKGTDGTQIDVYRDEDITLRPAFRFDAPAGAYDISCTPDVYFEVFHGRDLLRAARGYGEGLHPSLYFLAGAAVLLPVGSILWNRFVQRPRDWAYTPAE